jgi:hypothetical protein
MWLFIAFPLTAVVAGFVTLALAIQSDDGLVQDDYYKRGKEINRTLARDTAASVRGVSAHLAFDASIRTVTAQLHASDPTALPDVIEIKFSHATRPGLDRTLLAERTAPGRYRAVFEPLAAGRWNVQLAAQDWRLTGSLALNPETVLVLAPARTADPE